MSSGHLHPVPTHPPPHPHPHHNEASLSAVSAASAAAATPTISPALSTVPTASVTAPVNPVNNISSIPHVRLMCSYGGRILPRPGDHLLRYVGGETRMVTLPKTALFSTLLSLVSSLSPSQFSPKSPPIIKYQLPNEDLDSLISISSDDDLMNMLDELDRLNPSSRSPRLRLFLFASSNIGAFGSVLSTGESNQWFLDALNSAAPAAAALERRRSEASSSMMSDQPDYLTGIDTGSDRYLSLPYLTKLAKNQYTREQFKESESYEGHSPPLNDRSPANQDTDPAEPTEPVEPVQPTLPQEMIQTQPAPTPPVYYMPQPVPVYYVPAPVSYMQPSLDGRGPVPVHGYMPHGAYMYDQFVQRGAPGSYMYEQPPPGGYARAPVQLAYPPNAMFPPPPQQVLTDPGSKQAGVPGSDNKGGIV